MNRFLKLYFISYFLLYLFPIKLIEKNNKVIYLSKNQSQNTFSDAEWTIVGAGPSGITAIGILIDLGVPPHLINWIDPLFNVGRLGEYYEHVPGNTKNKMYIDFLKQCKIFQEVSSNSLQNLYSLDLEKCDILKIIIEPLKDITAFLRTKVQSIEGFLDELYFENNVWKIKVKNNYFTSRHVILASGSKPKELEYSITDIIPLDYALDKYILEKMVKPIDKIAVIGSSHSAVLILKFLSEISVKSIYHFYRHPFTFAIDMGDWTLNNTNGLKGIAAEWVKNILEKNPPSNLFQYKNTEENRKLYFPECNKIIYAIGYERNPLPFINVNGEDNELQFNPETGIIGPRLFGIGLAFSGNYTDPTGKKEQLIGLNGFMKYAQLMIPKWLESKNISKGNYIRQRKILSEYHSLFNLWIY